MSDARWRLRLELVGETRTWTTVDRPIVSRSDGLLTISWAQIELLMVRSQDVKMLELMPVTATEENPA